MMFEIVLSVLLVLQGALLLWWIEHSNRLLVQFSDSHKETIRQWRESIDNHRQFYKFIREATPEGSKLKVHDLISRATHYECDAKMLSVEEFLEEQNA